MSKKVRVFISHPFANDPKGNRERVERICKTYINKSDCLIPVSPLHLFSYMEGDEYREGILEVCKELIDICDVVHVYGSSKGCRVEKNYALQQGKEVTDFTNVINYGLEYKSIKEELKEAGQYA